MAAPPFAKGDVVQYHSDSHSCWMDTVVEAVQPTGQIQVRCKPGIWLALEEQKTKIRRAGPGAGSAGYNPSSRPCAAKTDCWSAEQALVIGPRTANQLGSRKPEELRWGSVLDSVTSVHQAVSQLNAGSIQCSSDFCIVYSASSSSHYLLYKKGAQPPSAPGDGGSSQVASLEAAVVEEKVLSSKVQLECDRLRTSQASLEERLRAEVEMRDTMRKRNQEECDSIQKELKAAKSTIAELRAAEPNPNMADAGADMEAQLRDLRQEIQELKARETASQASESEALKELQDKLIAETERRTQLEQEVANFDAIKNGLEKQVCETNAEMDRVQNEMETAAGAKDVLAEKLTAAEAEVRALKTESVNVDNRLAELNVELSKEKDANSLLKSKLTVVEEDLRVVQQASNAADAVPDQSEKLEEERKKRREAEESQEKLLEANEVLSTSRRSLEAELADVKTQLAALSSKDAPKD